MMTDQELLYAASVFCLKYTKSNGECSKSCPLRNQLCISRLGNLVLGESDHDDKINFVKFTEQFRNMIKIITDDREEGAVI